MVRRVWRATPRVARRVVVGVIGGTVILAGLAMVLLPGPAIVVIPAGLAILGIEFAWARRWLRKLTLRERSEGGDEYRRALAGELPRS